MEDWHTQTYPPGDPHFNPGFGERLLSMLSLLPAIAVVAILGTQYALRSDRTNTDVSSGSPQDQPTA